VRFEVLTQADMKMAVVRAIIFMMEAAGTSGTSVNFYQTARRNNPEESHVLSVH
jgi:hypothetical protein